MFRSCSTIFGLYYYFLLINVCSPMFLEYIDDGLCVNCRPSIILCSIRVNIEHKVLAVIRERLLTVTCLLTKCAPKLCVFVNFKIEIFFSKYSSLKIYLSYLFIVLS